MHVIALIATLLTVTPCPCAHRAPHRTVRHVAVRRDTLRLTEREVRQVQVTNVNVQAPRQPERSFVERHGALILGAAIVGGTIIVASRRHCDGPSVYVSTSCPAPTPAPTGSGDDDEHHKHGHHGCK